MKVEVSGLSFAEVKEVVGGVRVEYGVVGGVGENWKRVVQGVVGVFNVLVGRYLWGVGKRVGRKLGEMKMEGSGDELPREFTKGLPRCLSVSTGEKEVQKEVKRQQQISMFRSQQQGEE